MKNAKLVKMAVKFGLGAIVSASIGYMIKGEKKLEDRIDAYFDEKTDDEKN